MSVPVGTSGRLSRRSFSAVLAFAGFAASASGVSFAQESAALNGAEHPLGPALRHATICLEKAQAMKGYECTFAKKEVVGSEMISQTMKMKVRHDPFSVYMYFLEPTEGREVIFVNGRNDNKLQVHETGLASLIGTLSLSPDDSRVMAENRYPITKAGLAKLVEAVIEQWKAESKYGETEVKYFEDAKFGEYTCRAIESSHPQPRKQFRFHVTRLWIDENSGLPVRVQQFGFPRKKDAKPPVIEDYMFTDIKPEVRLTDRDFDTSNPSYNY
jgi:outer membrane lipoprotein-sorting protein